MKLQSFDDVNRSLAELAEHEAFITKKTAVLNELINNAKTLFEEETKDAFAAKLLIEKEIERFCLVNKNEFEKSRSKKLLFGEVGFRNNPAKVLQLNRKYSVATSVELLKKMFKKKFIRVKEEINKELILTEYAAKKLNDNKLAAVGLKVDQDETFSYKIFWEALDDKSK